MWLVGSDVPVSPVVTGPGQEWTNVHFPFPDVREGRERRLAEAERQIRERLGGGPALYRMESIAPWHPAPEMRVLQVPLDPSGGDLRAGLHADPVRVPTSEVPRGSAGLLERCMREGLATFRQTRTSTAA